MRYEIGQILTRKSIMNDDIIIPQIKIIGYYKDLKSNLVVYQTESLTTGHKSVESEKSLDVRYSLNK